MKISAEKLKSLITYLILYYVCEVVYVRDSNKRVYVRPSSHSSTLQYLKRNYFFSFPFAFQEHVILFDAETDLGTTFVGQVYTQVCKILIGKVLRIRRKGP